MSITKIAKSVIMAVVVTAAIPVMVLAQSPALIATISSPANNSSFGVNEVITFQSSATGGSGNESNYDYNWTWNDGTQDAGQNETHSYPTTGARTVTLRVTDFATGQTDTDSITVNITPDSACSPLIIESGANIPRATNVTSNSATIVWETCEPATSRVVYGTAQVTDAVAADDTSNNRGYQTSSSLDENKVTSHSVQLTGLEANTTYYFRVLSAR